MNFSSLLFLFFFLPAALLLYYAIPCGRLPARRRAPAGEAPPQAAAAIAPANGKAVSRVWRNLCLLVLSLVFYAWGDFGSLLLLLAVIAVDYASVLLVERFKDRRGRARAVMLVNVCLNLLLLCFFKYTGFLAGTLNSLGLHLAAPEVLLPLGVSFYTFRSITCAVDVYRGDAPATRNFIDFSLYIAFFPVLLQGPIVRYKDLQPQLRRRRESLALFTGGVQRMLLGLFKKVLLADALALLVQKMQAQSELSALSAWLFALAFTFQIYFDFAGYTDMALGIGQMFGFQLPENFDYPYVAKSASEFWRRWHMSLGSWFRDYVYIPLGGNRRGKPRLVLNLAVVWVLTGLWHGASWNFVLWGAYFGVLIICEKLFLKRALEKLPSFFQWLYGFVTAVLGWVLFANADIGKAFSVLGSMFGAAGGADALGVYSLLSFLPLLVIAAVCSSPLPGRLVEKLRCGGTVGRVLWCLGGAALFLLAVAAMLGSSYTPFLYAKF